MEGARSEDEGVWGGQWATASQTRSPRAPAQGRGPDSSESSCTQNSIWHGPDEPQRLDRKPAGGTFMNVYTVTQNQAPTPLRGERIRPPHVPWPEARTHTLESTKLLAGEESQLAAAVTLALESFHLLKCRRVDQGGPGGTGLPALCTCKDGGSVSSTRPGGSQTSQCEEQSQDRQGEAGPPTARMHSRTHRHAHMST